MFEDMQLRGLAHKTQDAYLRAAWQLAEYYAWSPERISEEELRQCFLCLKNEKWVSASGFSIALFGIEFFREHTLQRQQHIFELARVSKKHRLPPTVNPRASAADSGLPAPTGVWVCLTMIYACGLRIQEEVQYSSVTLIVCG